MGILRTDKISGLETPTAVTGSVEFDGNGDWITVAESEDFNFGTGDFTVEFWIYWDGFNSGGTRGVQLTAAVTNGIWIGQVNSTDYVLRSYGNANHLTTTPPPIEQWHHIAVTRKNSTARFFVNGKLEASGSVTHNFVKHEIVIGSDESSGHTNGYISNVRMLKGTALYTSDFTPPVHELQPIGDTVLLCCNNPDSAGAEATGKTITVNNDAVASTFSPGLTRDFTYGTEFRGVTTFDTQGYFVPPSGTTEQRSRGRGIFAGGSGTPTFLSTIDYIQISSSGNSLDFGSLTNESYEGGGLGSATRGLFALGYGNPANVDTIDFVTIASTGDAVDFGILLSAARISGTCSSSTRGLWGGIQDPALSNQIQYATIAALGNTIDFGDLTQARGLSAGLSSPTRGVFGGGRTPSQQVTIDYVTIATTGNAEDFGDLTHGRSGLAAAASDVRGVFAGAATEITIDYITIATTGNAQDFGDLSSARNPRGVSNSIRGVFGSGNEASPVGQVNTIEFITIASTGNANDFGDLKQIGHSGMSASDSHGGIS